MKKHFMFLMAVLFGILISFTGCKNFKFGSDNDDEKSEKVDKKHKKSKKNKKHKKSYKDYDEDEDEDYDDEDYDEDEDDDDDIDLSDLDLDDFKDITPEQIDNLSTDDAEDLLAQALAEVNKEFPQDLGDGLSMDGLRMSGKNVIATIRADFASQGLTIEMLQTALADQSVKQEMIKNMMEGIDNDTRVAYKLISKAKKNFVVKFIDEGTGDDASISLTPAEMARLGM